MTLSDFVEAFPVQSSDQWVAVTGKMDRYAGMAFVPDVHIAAVEAGEGATALGELAKSIFAARNEYSARRASF